MSVKVELKPFKKGVSPADTASFKDGSGPLYGVVMLDWPEGDKSNVEMNAWPEVEFWEEYGGDKEPISLIVVVDANGIQITGFSAFVQYDFEDTPENQKDAKELAERIFDKVPSANFEGFRKAGFVPKDFDGFGKKVQIKMHEDPSSDAKEIIANLRSALTIMREWNVNQVSDKDLNELYAIMEDLGDEWKTVTDYISR